MRNQADGQETVLKAKPNSLLDKVVHQLSSSSSAATSSSTAQAAAAAISKYANVFTSTAVSKNTASPAITNKEVLSPTLSTRSALPPHLTGMNGAASPLPRSGAMTPVGGKSSGLQRSDSVKGGLVNKGLEEQVWATDGVLTVDMAERMLKWHAEAVGRVVELSAAGDVYVPPEMCVIELKLQGQECVCAGKGIIRGCGPIIHRDCLGIVRRFVSYRGCTDSSALARLESADPKVEPDLTPLATLKPADIICHLSQRYAATALLPLSGSSAPLRREMVTSYSHNIVRMEGKIDALMQKAIDNIVSYLTFLLTKQKKNDYKPKDDELSFARNNTEPCKMSCEFLETVRDAAREGLSGKNAEGFLTEVGMAFHRCVRRECCDLI